MLTTKPSKYGCIGKIELTAEDDWFSLPGYWKVTLGQGTLGMYKTLEEALAVLEAEIKVGDDSVDYALSLYNPLDDE